MIFPDIHGLISCIQNPKHVELLLISLHVETQFDSKVKILRSDNEAEFLMNDFYARKGIISSVESLFKTFYGDGRD